MVQMFLALLFFALSNFSPAFSSQSVLISELKNKGLWHEVSRLEAKLALANNKLAYLYRPSSFGDGFIAKSWNKKDKVIHSLYKIKPSSFGSQLIPVKVAQFYPNDVNLFLIKTSEQQGNQEHIKVYLWDKSNNKEIASVHSELFMGQGDVGNSFEIKDVVIENQQHEKETDDLLLGFIGYIYAKKDVFEINKITFNAESNKLIDERFNKLGFTSLRWNFLRYSDFFRDNFDINVLKDLCDQSQDDAVNTSGSTWPKNTETKIIKFHLPIGV